ncbi:hypothetical protein H6G17_08520 [Chroococcidiopsis sp. FACHB-1243]|nr:hypothetical protein [Chroococcidiopsis sp. [FACHB-1243]]MBD2305558.1 hypothetical protein [Chroococcidiopsis sp. [FACHB-1243]]
MNKRVEGVEHLSTERDGAIALMATAQSLFNLPGRQTEGFVESKFCLDGN